MNKIRLFPRLEGMNAVAVSDSGRGQYTLVSIPNTVEAIRKLIGQLGKDTDLEVCYEEGPTGYGWYRLLRSIYG